MMKQDLPRPAYIMSPDRKFKYIREDIFSAAQDELVQEQALRINNEGQVDRVQKNNKLLREKVKALEEIVSDHISDSF